MNWISVKDKLPDTGNLGCQTVIALINDTRVYILDFVKDDGRENFYYNQMHKFENWTNSVTHWMPLPELPT